MITNDKSSISRHLGHVNTAYAKYFEAAGALDTTIMSLAAAQVRYENRVKMCEYIQKKTTLPVPGEFSPRIQINDAFLVFGSFAYSTEWEKMVWMVHDDANKAHYHLSHASNTDPFESSIAGYEPFRIRCLYDPLSLELSPASWCLEANILVFVTVAYAGSNVCGFMVVPIGAVHGGKEMSKENLNESCVRANLLPHLYLFNEKDMTKVPPLHAMGDKATNKSSFLRMIKTRMKGTMDPKILNEISDPDIYRRIMCSALKKKGLVQPLENLKIGLEPTSGDLVAPALFSALPSPRCLAARAGVQPLVSAYSSRVEAPRYSTSPQFTLTGGPLVVPLISFSDATRKAYLDDIRGYDFRCAVYRALGHLDSAILEEKACEEFMAAPSPAPMLVHKFKKDLDLPEIVWTKSEFEYKLRHMHMRFDDGADHTCGYCRKNPLYPQVICENCLRTFCVEHVMERKGRVFCASCMREEVKKDMTRGGQNSV